MTKEKNVQPIRSLEEIQKMKNSLIHYCSYRDYFLFVLGINVELRISDILPLRVRDVRDASSILIQESKTGLYKTIYLNEQLQKEIKKYTSTLGSDDLLFPSRTGDQSISVTQAYRILQKAAEKAGIQNVGARTLRKTFGYHHYQKHKDLVALQKIFAHSAPSITKNYIGI